MTTFIYNHANLSVKDRLTISNLLGLFQSRLNATWVPSSQAPSKTIHLLLIDVDQEEGLQSWESSSPKARIAITSNDRSQQQPFVSRPIRAYGPNGVIVLFNSIAQSLGSPAQENGIHSRQEPARIRMMGRLESPAAVRPIRPQAPPPQKEARPAPPVSEPPERVRVAVRWGPPEPVFLPPLAHMPGAKIHWFEPRKDAPAAPAPPIAPEPEVSPAKFFSAPGTDALPPLIDMPVAHRPTEIHTPPAPLIGRVNIETPPPATEEVPVLRPAPPEWRSPEPQVAKTLIDFRSLQDFTLPAVDPEPAIVNAEVDAPVPAPDASEEELQAEFASIEAGLESLSNALVNQESPEELAGGDADIDWWGATIEPSNDRPAEGCLLINALKAAKASGQPGILEIAGLPAVCVIPARNIYFTTAPAARLETAITARSEVAWRTYSSEAEAREFSGTEQSRQASLEQLFWTASLLTAPDSPASIADQAVRLRRWPPITESRGRSKFIRYATMISGAQATPRELSEITGDTLEEIVRFVNACSLMNLLETSGQPAAPLAIAPTRTAGAGILRDMIEQLTPPKI